MLWLAGVKLCLTLVHIGSAVIMFELAVLGLDSRRSAEASRHARSGATF